VHGVTFPLETERLLLRPFTDADGDALFAIYGPPDNSRFLYTEPRTREEIPDMIERAKQLSAIDDEHDGLRLAAVLATTGEVVGDVSLWRVSREHRQGEVGYVLDPAHKGHGYATEAVREMLRVGFELVGFHPSSVASTRGTPPRPLCSSASACGARRTCARTSS
jgi:RimJ/RimL family protein N-acetyltransferase